MLIQPLIQTDLFDVADWETDEEFGIFPQGARAKASMFAPDEIISPVLVPGKRYLFKLSNKRYPEQFWCEVVAYRIGCLLGMNVPPAFAAYNSHTGLSAALIEWFYIEGRERFMWGGEFLTKIQPDFDRKLGTNHNLFSNSVLMKVLVQSQLLSSDWRRWWVEALLFDALIGNTDRHQDNWGLIFYAVGEDMKCKLSPLFDNGTSMGCERFIVNVENWTDHEVDRYVNKGTHCLQWSCEKNAPEIRGHFDLLKRSLEEWPEMKEAMRAKLNFSQNSLEAALGDLCQIGAPVPLSAGRMKFMLRLIKHRHSHLMALLS